MLLLALNAIARVQLHLPLLALSIHAYLHLIASLPIAEHEFYIGTKKFSARPLYE
jgi:hypothetical protein